MNLREFFSDLLYKVIPEREFKHLKVTYRLKSGSDIYDGIQEVIGIAKNKSTDDNNSGLWLECNGINLLIHKDSSVEELYLLYHESMKIKGI